MHKGEPYRKTELANYECIECNKNFKLDDIDKHVKMNVEHLTFNKAMNTQGVMPMGLLGMLMTHGNNCGGTDVTQ